LTPQIAVSPGPAISGFKVFAGGAVYQTFAGIYYLRYTNPTSPTVMGGTAPSCDAFAVDSTDNVYCRTNTGVIYMWSYPIYSAPPPLYPSVPSGGADLVVDYSSGPIYFSTTTAISYVTLPAPVDGGVASPTSVITGQAGPRGLVDNSSHFWWFDIIGNVY